MNIQTKIISISIFLIITIFIIFISISSYFIIKTKNELEISYKIVQSIMYLRMMNSGIADNVIAEGTLETKNIALSGKNQFKNTFNDIYKEVKDKDLIVEIEKINKIWSKLEKKLVPLIQEELDVDDDFLIYYGNIESIIYAELIPKLDSLDNQMKDNVNKEIINTEIYSLLVILTSIIVLIILLYISIKKIIISPLNKFRDGFLDFFFYLNGKTTITKPLSISTNDEFSEMAKILNDNIEKTRKNIDEDKILISETVNVLSEFENGDLSQRITKDSTNPALNELKNVLNNMGEHLEKNISNILNILEKYTQYNYIENIDTRNLKEHLLQLANGVNNLGDSITNNLIKNKKNGLTMDAGSNILLVDMNNLSQSSTHAAASIEETAAAIDQITGNIRNNTENIAKMAQLSQLVTQSANDGEDLANKTTLAMEEINKQVTSINEAITVIDQISFQTNILSLNAAVEAATAGEAGKGFAVVAQEVRNLATRSAEAAKEIKSIVEVATSKANEGKDISNNMINGYKNLNENIIHTIELIGDIKSASTEQLKGIEQINDAITSLDQQTQQNATIASKAYDIVEEMYNLSKLVVSDANAKEFNGKNEIKAEKLKNE